MQSRPNRLSLFLIPLFVVVAALAGWAVLKQRDRATPVVDSSDPALTAQTSAATVTAAPGAARPTQPAAAPGLAGSALLSKLPMTEADRLKVLADRDKQMAEFERSHRAEPIDATWAAQARSDLGAIVESEALKTSGIEPSDYTADCRSSTCRISANFTSSGNAEDWGTFFLASSGKTLRQAKMTIIQNPQGGAEVRIYGARR